MVLPQVHSWVDVRVVGGVVRCGLPAHVVLLCLMIRSLLAYLAMLVLAVRVLRVVIVDSAVLSLLALLATL